jgi:hypothetical protein
MKRSSTGLAVGVALLVMMFSPAAARAGSLKIWMDKFSADWQPMNGISATRTVVHSPGELQSSATDPSETTLYYWAPVNLPAGTVIKSAVYHHVNHSSVGNNTACYLMRVKFGQAAVPLAVGGTTEAGSVAVPLVGLAPENRTIKANSRYYVQVMLNPNTSVRGVEIFY